MFLQSGRGLFESPFVIQTLALLLRSMKGSAGNYGKPCGAIALAAAAVSVPPLHVITLY